MSHLVLTRSFRRGKNAVIINEELRIEIEKRGAEIAVHFFENGKERKYEIRREEVPPLVKREGVA